jgi:hypothetical protein
MDKVIRFFTCGITGDECAIILRDGEEICVTAEEAMWMTDMFLMVEKAII